MEKLCPLCQLSVEESNHYCFNCNEKSHAICDFLKNPIEEFGSPTLCKTCFDLDESLANFNLTSNTIPNKPQLQTQRPAASKNSKNSLSAPRTKQVKLDSWIKSTNNKPAILSAEEVPVVAMVEGLGESLDSAEQTATSWK